MPLLNARLRLGEHETEPQQFLLDSGAALSVVPSDYADDLPALSLSDIPSRWTGLKDASGRRIMGRPVLLTVRVQGLQDVEDELWFSDEAWLGVLGQRRWFERVGAVFMNFPTHQAGRRFELFQPRE